MLAFHGAARRVRRAAAPALGPGGCGCRRALRQPDPERGCGSQPFRQHDEHAAAAQPFCATAARSSIISAADQGAGPRRLRASGLFLRQSHRQTEPAAQSRPRAAVSTSSSTWRRANSTAVRPHLDHDARDRGMCPTAVRAARRCSISISMRRRKKAVAKFSSSAITTPRSSSRKPCNAGSAIISALLRGHRRPIRFDRRVAEPAADARGSSSSRSSRPALTFYERSAL